ncbi:MAG: CAP domain-containing protein [Patescibacteria group bacterium]|nr:CAP domain-containing protein [Patescibacteria group bacterium]
MKNKYKEVEVVPFLMAENKGGHFRLKTPGNRFKELKHPFHLFKKIHLAKCLSSLLLATLLLLPFVSFGQGIDSQTIINLTNQERLNHNLPQLKLNSNLTQAAVAKAKDMLADDYFAHFAPDGKKPWDFIHSSGYDYKFAGENLAMDFSSASGAMQGWMASPTHRENILSSDYDEIGVAVLNGKLQGHSTILIVQMFGHQDKAISSPPVVATASTTESTITHQEETPEPKPAPAVQVEKQEENKKPENNQSDTQTKEEDKKVIALENNQPPVENKESKNSVPEVKPQDQQKMNSPEPAKLTTNKNLHITNYFFFPDPVNLNQYNLFVAASPATERLVLIKNNQTIRFHYFKNNLFIKQNQNQFLPHNFKNYQALTFEDRSYNSQNVKLAYNYNQNTRLAINSQVKGVKDVKHSSKILSLLIILFLAEIAIMTPKLWHIWHHEQHLIKKKKVDSFLSFLFFILTLIVPYM